MNDGEFEVVEITAEFGATIPTASYSSVRVGYSVRATVPAGADVEAALDGLHRLVRDKTRRDAAKIAGRAKAADDVIFSALPDELQRAILEATNVTN